MCCPARSCSPGTNRRRTAQALYRRVRGVGVPFDVVVATEEDLDRYRDNLGLIYRQALEEKDIPFDPTLIVSGNGRLDGGERALLVLTSLGSPPTAVFCYNDMTAIGLMRAARQSGLSVPDDLAVVGFDDIPLASYVCPSLTTIAQPQRDMGRQAMNMALLLMAAGDSITPFSDIVVKGRLIVRET